MTRRISFRPEAEAEALETREWYEGRQAGLGRAFSEAVENAVERIVSNPLQFPCVRRELRRAVLKRFPYAVYFRLAERDIIVLAVHGRQHPRRWQSRA